MFRHFAPFSLSAAAATKRASRRSSFPGLILVLLSPLLLAGCAESGAGNGDERIHVVTTATMVTDLVEQIGGDRVRVEGLMGPGVDPHLYRPAASALGQIRRADAIFYMGLFFEEQMQRILNDMKGSGRRVYAVTDAIPRERLLRPAEFDGQIDPHVWFDAELWALCTEAVIAGLREVDPAEADFYRERGEAYRRELEELHNWAIGKAAELPEEKRVLVTSHDAYNYFGRAYGFEVIGLQGISTVSEAGLADITNLVDFIREREVNAIFVESSISPRAIERVSRDAGVAIGGEIFSDAMGGREEMRDGFAVGTYPGMIRYNLNTIVEALK